ncbi:hypothetical protein FRC19_006149 [Serendipita sp. 401]|nr:hypothetical protein FRC19_006149 [Serendipita sp. 401]
MVIANLLFSDVGYSLWFTFLVVRTSKRDPTVWSRRFKSFDWDGSRSSGTMSGHGHGQHDALISPASPLGLLTKGGGGGGGGEKKGISTIVMPTPPETAEIPTASSVSVPAPRKNSTWMMFPTRASRPRPRLESTPHLPIQNLPPPTPYTAVPASASAPAIGMATANATLTLQSQSPPPPLMSATSSIPPVPPLPLQYQYQPHQQQQQVQQVQQMQYQQDGLLSPVHLSPVPQDVPEDISLSGTPAALRPVSLAQSLAQKQRQMIMSIKPLRLGLGRSGGRASIDKTMIGQPKAFVDPMGATRRHHSFDDDYSSVAESKYMSMTMTAAEATFNHWWRPESSFAPGGPQQQQLQQGPLGSRSRPQTQSPLRGVTLPGHGRSRSDESQYQSSQYGYRMTLEPATANSPNHSPIGTLNTDPHRHLSTDSKNSNNVQFLRPPNPKFLSVGGAPTVSSRYSTATHATTIPPTPPPKDRWRNLPPPLPVLEVQPRIEEFQFTIPSPQHPQQQQPQLFSSSSPGAPIPSPLQFPSPPAVVAAMSSPSPVPSVASTVPTPAPASAPARAMSPGPGPTISPPPGPGAFVPPAVAVTRPSMSRSNTHTTNASGKGSMKGSVSNAISERRFMTSPTKGFI